MPPCKLLLRRLQARPLGSDGQLQAFSYNFIFELSTNDRCNFKDSYLNSGISSATTVGGLGRRGGDYRFASAMAFGLSLGPSEGLTECTVRTAQLRNYAAILPVAECIKLQ